MLVRLNLAKGPHDQRRARFGWFVLRTSGVVRLGDGW
jgi:hypothetical protein